MRGRSDDERIGEPRPVIGAVVIAPGFEPLLRMSFGLVAGPHILAPRGLLSSVTGCVVNRLSNSRVTTSGEFRHPALECGGL